MQKLMDFAALIQALKTGQADEASVLLDHHPEAVSLQTPLFGSSLLSTAAGHAARDVVEVLLRHGADVNAQSGPMQRRALDDAAGRGMVDNVLKLLAYGADPNLPTYWQCGCTTPLQRACSAGQMETARVLIAAGADPGLRCRDGSTALYSAAYMGHKDIVSFLRQSGVQPDIFTAILVRDGEAVIAAVREDATVLTSRLVSYAWHNAVAPQPLHLAVTLGSRELTQLLVNLGADLEALTHSGLTPLSLALSRSVRMQDNPLEKGPMADYAKAIMSADAGAARALKRFIDSGPDRWRPIADYLLRRGAKYDLTSYVALGDKAAVANAAPQAEPAALRAGLFLSASLGNVELLRTIVEHVPKASLSLPEVRIEDLAHTAALSRSHECLDFLLDELRVPVPAVQSWSILHGMGPDVVEHLLRYCDRLDYLYADGHTTPLCDAFLTLDTGLLRLLLQHGADPNYSAGPPYHFTPLHLAVLWKRLGYIRMLCEAGAHRENRDAVFNATPLEWASFAWYPDPVPAEVEAVLAAPGS